MPIDSKRARNYLKHFEFEPLFVQELGWDYYEGQHLHLSIEGNTYTLNALVEKRGMVVYRCTSDNQDRIPEYATRRQIDKEAAKYAHEHLIIYIDAAQTEQVWQWVRREIGKPTACREHRFHTSQSGTALLQKLEAIAFSLEEEESLTLVEVTGRARRAFNVDRVTNRFYDRFKREHATFLQLIQSIDIASDQEWYASLMLNRLMFIYFIQKQGFLNEDKDYLRRRLLMCQEQHGRDAFHSFYRYFLLRLCHEGLGKQERSPELEKLLGKVPYLNGGLFEVHPLEVSHPNIQIPDAAFETIFNFFEEYQWHLDERPLRNDQEINPDVLGYIFEKYTNQKQMGAYYTKEDITEYISKNCIIPFIFENVDKQVGNCLFKLNGLAWKLLREDPDRYIYEAVRKGVDIPLPDAIAGGINNLSQRDGWNRPADSELALPTETWREHIARRTRCLELRQKLASGEIQLINDLITHNLNIRQLAQDVIENCFDPELLWAFHLSISQITVLDPTCGSGAFLFAALNILEPLYDASFERMQIFLDEDYRFSDDRCVQRLQEFRHILQQIDQHLNRRYFILKSIVINNLYGVDIMQEVTEICKLRLFLKLMAQVEPDASKQNYGIEPLPDIDFNIRAGNTLVGFANYDEVKKAVEGGKQKKLDLFSDMARLDEKAQAVDRSFQAFRELQTNERVDGGVTAQKKAELRSKLSELKDELDRYLADEYETGQSKKLAVFKKWRESHQPFHWFVEFYGIISIGGFYVIIGNPPYVEYSKVKKDYSLREYQTESCGNLYAFVVERVTKLLPNGGKLGVIIPVASVCTDGYLPLQQILKNAGNLTISSFNDRPGKLFNGLEHIRLSIILWTKRNSVLRSVFTTKYNKWRTIERPELFYRIAYTDTTNIVKNSFIPKLSSEIEKSSLGKILSQKKTLSFYIIQGGSYRIYYTRKLSGFVQVLDFIPSIYDENNQKRNPSELKNITFYSQQLRDAFLAILNSNTFYWLLTIYSDCRNLNKREVYSVPFDFESASEKVVNKLSSLAQKLMKDLEHHSELIEMTYKTLGKMTIQCIFPKLSKPIIDEIDHILAQHYGFTEEELDFIINYDLKYRMKRDEEDED